MKQGLMKKIVLGVCLLLWFPLTVLGAVNTNQKPEVQMTDDRVITWLAYDTKATSKITWKTEGYTIKTYPVLSNDLLRTKEFGNPVYKKPYGLFYTKKEYENIIKLKDGIYHIKWAIPQDVVDKQIKNAGTTAQILEQNNGKLYMNSFFRTYHYGKVHTPYIYDFYGIRKAETWDNPNDFRDYFDIPVPYHSKPVPVEIVKKEYYDGSYQVLSKKEVGQKQPYTFFNPQKDIGSTFVNALSRSEKSKISYRQGKTIYLYKVELLDKKTGKKISFPENNNYTDKNSKKVKSLSLLAHPIKEESKHRKEVTAFQGRKWDIGADGITLVLYYRYVKDTQLKEDQTTESISDDFTDPAPPNNEMYGVIKAEQKGSEKFNVEDGIPTSEQVYSYVVGQRYLVSYTFTNIKGSKEFIETKKKQTGTDDKGKPLYDLYDNIVTRSYSYWKVTQLDVYELEKATVNNYALPNGKITLHPSSNYQSPKVVYNDTSGLIDPKIVTNDDGTTSVGRYQSSNDTLEIDGKVLMRNYDTLTPTTPKPNRLTRPNAISDNILYQKEMIIATEKENGEYDSDGVLTYRRIKRIGESQGSKLTFDLDINPVVIHTPTICKAKVENVKKYNQMINPETRVANLILDQSFKIQLDTVGVHRNIKGYGYRDYKKYMSTREVKFPFDVYYIRDVGEKKYLKANTWVVLNDHTEPRFYLPSWVEEGYYSIDFRTYSINATTNERRKQEEEEANYELENYVATDKIVVRVSGRLFGLAIYDITDYPIWQNVFRIPDTTKLTGNRYTVGLYDRNGERNKQTKQMTLPLIYGSNPDPKYSCEGAMKLGYVARFYCYTMGNFYDQNSTVKIKPRFYYVTKDGKTKKEVDLYYNETSTKSKQYERMIKVGSQRDLENVKKLRLNLLYTSVPKQEIKDTEQILGMRPNSLSTNVPVYTFGKISIPWKMRTFVGTFKNSNKPQESLIRRSVQKWYFEYYLPATLFIVEKDVDIWDWASKNGNGKIYFDEPFFLDPKKGYILVNFDIIAYQNGKPYLSYINEENAKNGYCNMWQLSGFQYQKTDCKGSTFHFTNGDIALFDPNRTVTKDYVSGGTH